MLLFISIILTILGSLHLHINFSIYISIFKWDFDQNLHWVCRGILEDTADKLNLPIHDHRISLDSYIIFPSAVFLLIFSLLLTFTFLLLLLFLDTFSAYILGSISVRCINIPILDCLILSYRSLSLFIFKSFVCVCIVHVSIYL